MNLLRAMDITASGLSASRVMMNVAASNLANANTTRTAEGGPYQRRNVVLGSTPLAEQRLGFRDMVTRALRSVDVVDVKADGRAPRTVYDPGHPDADKQGIVRLPNVNMIEEMVDMITASRSYEAGVNAMQSLKSMANKALSIGR